MKAIFDEAKELLSALKDGFRDADTDDLLRVLVHHPGNEDPVYYFKGELTVQYFSCDLDEKIALEISRWVKALSQALEQHGDVPSLFQLSPALYTLHQTQPREEVNQVLARTLRMLHLLEALFLNHKCSEKNPYCRLAISALPESEKKLVQDCKQSRVPLEFLPKWEVSLPCLLIIAVAESQCEYRQPFAWEAYSAGRARDELRRRWGGVGDKLLNTLALLICYQSAVGQLQRKNGGRLFIDSIKNNKSQENLEFDESTLFNALKLLAVVEEARNHKIPQSSDVQHIENLGCNIPWEDKDFLKRAHNYLMFDQNDLEITKCPTTYAFFRPGFVGLNEMEDIQVLENIKIILSNVLSRESWKTEDLFQISFGRYQTRQPLRKLMGEVLKKVNSSDDPEKTIEEYFDLSKLEVPHPFVPENNLKVLRVLLKDHLSAQKFLFPSKRLADIEKNHPPQNDSASELFNYLLDIAVETMGLNYDTMWDENQKNDHFPSLSERIYVPYPLVRRITEIVYRLKPDLCFNVPISINHEPTEWIHIPIGVTKNDHRSKRVFANLVLATIQNRAMSIGLDYGEVDLANLARLNYGLSNVKQNQYSGSEFMQPEDWQQLITVLYIQGGYDVLLGRYIRDYNTRRETVRFETRLSTETQLGSTDTRANSAALNHIREDLDIYLRGAVNNSQQFWLLGVDIGGTLTKCQFFCYESSEFKPCSNVFRMSTPPIEPTFDDKRSVQENVQKATKDFASRLLQLVKEQATESFEKIKKSALPLVIGLTWPGPVREDHVAGTSGILKNFPPLKPVITENQIDNVWKIDIAQFVQNTFNSALNNQKPFVALLNDGDAEAVGTVIEALQSQQNTSASGETHLSLGPRLAVVKLGTGLAGGLLVETVTGKDTGKEAVKLSLMPGLNEWGKMVLDLGAPPRKDFPRGVAGEYLSKKCLPNLASNRGLEQKFFSQAEKPDSSEIGLLLDIQKNQNEQSYQRLRTECGAILAEQRPLYGNLVSAEVLKVVYRNLTLTERENGKGKIVDPDLLYQVQLALRQADVEKELRRHLEGYGRIRIERLIGIRPITNSTLGEMQTFVSNPKFDSACIIADKCAKILGNYLGDFCVLLHDQLDVNKLILTGGVLSGVTGETAKKAAIERVKLYGLKLSQALNFNGFEIRERKEGIPADLSTEEAPINKDQTNMQRGGNDETINSHSDTNIPVERGARGAACFAAASFVQDKQQQGLQHLRQLLLPLPAGSRIEVNDDQIKVNDESPLDKSFDRFGKYALSRDIVIRFLDDRGPNWGFYRSTDNKFVRWVQR